MTRVKICGLTREKDALLAIELGADAIGFIHERTSPRFIGEGELPWLSNLPPFPLKVAVFGKADRPIARSIFDVIQAAEWESFPEPPPKRIHVIRLRPGQTVADFANISVNASAIMLDAYSPAAYGGTGEKIDWNLAAEIVVRCLKPVILAGGLSPDNVAEAVRRVKPFAVDVASGVEESAGIKDPSKLRDFIQAAKTL